MSELKHDEMLKLFMRSVIHHINTKYAFASVLMDIDEQSGKFDIICQINPHFLFIIDKSQILGLTRYADVSSYESISNLMDSDKRGAILNRAIETCVNRNWINLIKRHNDIDEPF